MGIANKRLAAAWTKDYLCLWRLIGLKPKPIWMQSPCVCAEAVPIPFTWHSDHETETQSQDCSLQQDPFDTAAKSARCLTVSVGGLCPEIASRI